MELYQQIYKKLNSLEDVSVLSSETDIPKDVLFNILLQKIVRKVKLNYKNYKSMISEDSSVIEIARELEIPPVIVLRIKLEKKGYGKRRIKKILKNPELIEDEELRREVLYAISNDFVFSPYAQRVQRIRGNYVEEIVRLWLEDKNIKFYRENEIPFKKTPDFLICSDLNIDGMKINWIECKALFGDLKEHRYYLEKQYSHYVKVYGKGMVVYWYSFVDGIERMEQSIIIKDRRFFCDKPRKIAETSGESK